MRRRGGEKEMRMVVRWVGGLENAKIYGWGGGGWGMAAGGATMWICGGHWSPLLTHSHLLLFSFLYHPLYLQLLLPPTTSLGAGCRASSSCGWGGGGERQSLFVVWGGGWVEVRSSAWGWV